MKTCIYALLLVTTASFTFANFKNESIDRMPSKFDHFDSTMVIHLYHGGGMHYSSKDIYIRFDSCIRVDMLQGKDRVTKFAMTLEMRSNVFSILVKNNVEYIKQKEKSSFANDKATKSICIEINGKKDLYFSSGSSTEIAEKSAADFNKIWEELEKFSLKNP